MLRRLHQFLALLSALVLAAVLALWLRSPDRMDTFSLRSGRSYTSGPRVKWLVLNNWGSLVFSAYQKTMPSVEVGDPPWRKDIPVGFTVPAMGAEGASIVKRPTSPMPRFTRPMTDTEGRGYETGVAPAYAGLPRVRWETGTPPRITLGGRPFRGPRWTVQFAPYAQSGHIVDSERFPGAYRIAQVRVPFPLAAVAATVLPLSCVPYWLKRRAARRRLRQGLCPRCGYDLRESPTQCPECGRATVSGEADRARLNVIRSFLATVRTLRPRAALVPGAVAAAIVVLVFVTVRGSGGPADAAAEAGFESRRLRGELEAQFAVIAGEVERLRRDGGAGDADRLGAELQQFRRRAAGEPQPAGDGPELHVVGIYEGDYPGGKPAQPARLPPQVPPVRPAPGPSLRPPRPTPPPEPQGNATVEVTATDRPVVLALCAARPVKWEVRVATGVRLEKVLLGGRQLQEVTGLPPGVPTDPLLRPGGADGLPVYAYRRGDRAFEEVEAALREHTGLPIHTFQGRYSPEGKSVVVGPAGSDWEAQRSLADLRPLYLRATEFGRARARAAAQSLRFTAICHEEGPLFGVRMRRPAPKWLAQFDGTGPVRSTFQPLPQSAAFVAGDPAGETWHATGHSELFTDGGQGGAQWAAIPFDASLQKPSWCAGLAYDPRRQRLMMISQNGGGATAYTYAPGANTWAVGPSLGREPGYLALTFSEHDDCYYALGRASGRDGRVSAITRISPDGKAEWRIPVVERIGSEPMRDRNWPAQIVAVGARLVILTPPLPDPIAPEKRLTPRCIVIDPRTYAVEYSGPIAPHDEPAPTIAPLPGPGR